MKKEGGIPASGWLDVHTLKTLSRHTSGALGALIASWLIGHGVQYFVDGDTLVGTIVSWTERIVFVGVFLQLSYSVLRTFYFRHKDTNVPLVVVALSL